MRMLSLSLVAFAVLSFVPAASAQQGIPARKANIQAKAEKTIAQQKAHAKALARFNAWKQSVALKNRGNGNQNQAVGPNRGKSMPGAKSMMHKNAKHAGKAKARNVSNSKPIHVKQGFGKHLKTKAALRAHQKALMKQQAKTRAKLNGQR